MTNECPARPLTSAELPRREAAQRWLLRAAPNEQSARTEWSTYGSAVLVAGHAWDAVRVPYSMLDSTFDHDTETAVLRAHVHQLRLVGPIFCDPYRPFMYFLVPPGTDRTWPRDSFPHPLACLGGTEPYVHHVAVPAVWITDRPGLFWLVPPDVTTFRHVDPAHLIAVLRLSVPVTIR